MRYRSLSIAAWLLASSATAVAASLPEGEVAVAQKPALHVAAPVETAPETADPALESATGEVPTGSDDSGAVPAEEPAAPN